MITIRDSEFNIVSQSKNLRGILRYKCRVERVDVWHRQVGITWTDGASTITDFGDHGIMLDWIKRSKIFRGITPNIHEELK